MILAFALNLQARQISESEALTKAKTFMSSSKLKSAKNATLKLANIESSESAADYYVFNRGDNEGFVIISGSDKTDAVIGYSDKGSFDANLLPDNMKGLLESYVSQIKEAESGNYTSPKEVKAGKSAAPLLGDIAWGQDSPYNNKCPLLKNGRRSVTGCLATAFTQVLYYHKWPAKGVGSHTYTSQTNKLTLSADFGATTYRWDLMTPTYSRNSTAESKDAVATIMNHVGIGSNMDYGEVSGATSPDGAYALRNYFNYDKGLRFLRRDYMTGTEWVSMIKNEIDNKRPVVYGAQSSQGGHAFVLDGYDEKDLFHVNWGWDGMSNGYFKITILDPAVQGTGGSISGFYYMHEATVGIQAPAADTEDHSGYIIMDSFVADNKPIAKGNNTRFTLQQFFSYGYDNFNGRIGFGFYDEAGNLVAVSSENSNRKLKRYSGYAVESSLQTLPSEIAPGRYTVHPICKMSENKNWERAGLRYTSGTTYAVVDDKTITFSRMPYSPKMEVSNLVQDKAYMNVPVTIKFDIENQGDEYYSSLYVGVFDATNKMIYRSQGIIESISRGEKKSMEITQKYPFAEGDYKVAILDNKNRQLCTPVPFHLYGAPKVGLELVDASFPDPDNVPNSYVVLNVKIKNNSDFYKGDLYANVYKMSGGKAVERWETVIEVNEESTADIKIQTASRLPLGQYKLNLSYFNYSTNKVSMFIPIKFFNFTLVDGAGVESVVEDENVLSVYPNPATDVLHLNVNGTVENVSIFNMTGALVMQSAETEVNVADLVSGNYFVKVVVDGKTTVKQFIKK